MKVTQHTDDNLVLGDVPWILSLILVGMVLVFVFAGLQIIDDGETWEGAALAIFGGGFCFAFLVGFAERSQAVFDKLQGRITVRSRSLLGYKQNFWPLSDVERAIVEKMSGESGYTYRPTLMMRGDSPRRIPLRKTYASDTSAEAAVETINAWLATLDSKAEAP